MLRRLLKNERGTATLLALGFLMFLLAMIGVAVDLGYQMSAIGELERTVEAAALAGAGKLGFNDTVFPTVRDFAVQYGQVNPHHNPYFGNLINLDLNTGNAANGNIVLGVWQNNAFTPSLDGTVVNAVRCQFASQIPTTFLQVLGIQTLPIAASAIAVAMPPAVPPADTCLFPIGLSACFFNGATSVGCGATVTFISSSDSSAVGANTAGWVSVTGENINANTTATAIQNAASGVCGPSLETGQEVPTQNGMVASVYNNTLIPTFIEKYNASPQLEVLKQDGTPAYQGKGWEVFVPVVDTGEACPPGAVNGNKQVVGFTRFVITQVRNNNGECAVANHWGGNPWDPKCFTNKNGTAETLEPGDVGSRGVYGYYDCTYFPAPSATVPVPITALATKLRLVKMYQ